ncbi:TIR domain-containing protein [Virgibacillus sp. MSJ-26]|uniref:TIR domain-containing protein n=1 Tax=Virgibacillus sp. MSJ-26 TaxID=2841522 RepID=UPI001C120DB8|nr:TIR domain-containing protein [Virgibacillus sp. MSJ-26]
MFRTIEDIKNKISENDRKNTTYIHPIASDEEIAKLISAYSNSDGGDIIFGIRDDAKRLELKKFPFKVDLERIQDLIEGSINIKSGYLTIEDASILFISVNKSDELVKVNKVPYRINGNGALEELKVQKVFISYAHKDSDLVNLIEEKISLYKNLETTRDINVTQYRDSLSEFMQTIRNHDVIIALVTSAYIKSLNCMYEITQLMKDIDYQKKLFFIVVNSDDYKFYKEENRYENYQANIYSVESRLAYLSYWSDEQTRLEQSIKEANLRPAMMANIALDLRKLESILPAIDDFIALLNDRVGRNFKEMYETDFKDIVMRN